MKKTIQNQFLTITVDRTGAELVSIKNNAGKELMWEADPEVWGRHAPILFPIVGKLKDDTYSYNGRNYSLKQHGFARDQVFELISETENSLSFELRPTPDTQKDYPFDFSLIVKFTLTDNSLDIEYKVKNNSSEIMPFSIGAHPAFTLKWAPDDRIEDYYIEFEKPETVDTHHLDEDHLLSDETETVLSNEKIIPLHENMFDRDALVLLDLESEKASLCSTKHSRKIILEFPDFPFLGVWAKPKAPYVCIEPWFGHVDPAGVDGNIMNKPGIITLEPGGLFSCNHRITIIE